MKVNNLEYLLSPILSYSGPLFLGGNFPFSNSLNCKPEDIVASSNFISARCEYSDNSLVTGFQMIVQLNSFTQLQRIYVTKASDGHTSAGVSVHENGMYRVTIFAIKGRQGILNSGVEISQEVVVVINSRTRGRQLNKVFLSFSYK